MKVYLLLTNTIEVNKIKTKTKIFLLRNNFFLSIKIIIKKNKIEALIKFDFSPEINIEKGIKVKKKEKNILLLIQNFFVKN